MNGCWIVPWVLWMLLAGCTAAPPPATPPAPPSDIVEAPAPPPAAVVIPERVRAALANAAPREAALVAAPDADADSIALVRLLDANVRHALANVERDGGRHVTLAAVAQAKTAVRDLQNHLDEFQTKPSAASPQQ